MWYDPPNKDTFGWRGSAQFAIVNNGAGDVIVGPQGRTLDRRHQEVKMHGLYLVYTVALSDNKEQQWRAVAMGAERLTASFVTFGVVFRPNAGWHLTPRSLTFDGRRSFEAALPFASTAFRLEHASTIRTCKGVVSMFALSGGRPIGAIGALGLRPGKHVVGEVAMWR